MTQGMELWRPDWFKVMDGYFEVGGLDANANELVLVTRETARISLAALRMLNEQDAGYHRTVAARELMKVLNEKQRAGREDS